MLPSVVIQQVQDSLLDYLTTTLRLRDAELEAALRRFLLDPEDGIFRGPYLDVRLPFRKVDEGAELPLDLVPRLCPCAHQLRAFERLTSRDGRTPRSTLVTTGTGSGKTECFLYPLLDHCRRERLRGKGGIKAVLLYPMNSLAGVEDGRRRRDPAPRRGDQRAALARGHAAQAGTAAGERSLVPGGARRVPASERSRQAVQVDRDGRRPHQAHQPAGDAPLVPGPGAGGADLGHRDPVHLGARDRGDAAALQHGVRAGAGGRDGEDHPADRLPGPGPWPVVRSGALTGARHGASIGRIQQKNRRNRARWGSRWGSATPRWRSWRNGPVT